MRTYVINGQKYEFLIALVNNIDDTFPLNKTSCPRIVLEERIEDWPVKGFIVFENNHNAFERPSNELQDPGLTYRFRGDGNDHVVLKVRPIIENEPEDIFTPSVWDFEYVFTVYDIQDIVNEDDGSIKYKKIFFWEKDYQTMLNNIQWSTTELLNVNPAQCSDEERRVKTGVAIKDLIEKSLSPSEQVFSNSWDDGASSIFYTSPAQNNVIDDLSYLLSKHVSENTNDFCILQRDRLSKQWSLTSLSNLFSKAVDKGGPGELQIEHFFIDSLVETHTSGLTSKLKTPSPYKTPTTIDKISLERNIQISDHSIIKSFQFTDMSAIDNIESIISKPVYSDSISEKQFSLDLYDNEITNIKNFFRDNVVEKLRHSGCEPDPLFTINKEKHSMVKISNEYSFGNSYVERYAEGRNRVLKAALYLNQCIVFRCKGLTSRRKGVFIGIDRETGFTENEFDYKLCGQWFVTNVKHIFIDDEYVNEITAVKVHSSGPLSLNRVENYSNNTKNRVTVKSTNEVEDEILPEINNTIT